MIKPANANSTKTPSILSRWRFAGLSAAELLPQLQRYLIDQDTSANWQLVWLNNDGKPVIGLLPKVSWSTYFNTNSQTTINNTASYKVLKTCRATSSSTTKYMSYTEWQDELIAYSNLYSNSRCDNNDSVASSISNISDEPSYHHGLIGFIGYDIASFELSPMVTNQQTSQPCAVLGHYDIYLSPANDTVNDANHWQLNVRLSDCDGANESIKPLLNKIISYLESLDHELSKAAVNNKTALREQTKLTTLTLTAQWQKEEYEQAFAQTQRYLQQGDCYQINLTQVWQGCLNKSHDDNETAHQLIDYLPSLHANTNAPFAGYLASTHSSNNAIENTNFELLSCSPELFFTFIKNKQTQQNYIRTKPIKGTIPRGINPKQDVLLKQQLLASDKDRSENVMIVDLLRNDLGKYAKTGSVKVPQLFAIESFSNVHHMVSTITAELKENTHPLAVLFGSLPAGSITGTPKKRAVEIIAELEIAPRGAYCGTLGYMNFEGSGQWNVLIRTLQSTQTAGDAADNRQVSLWAGGGITVASSCASEYQECLDKVGNLLGVLAQSSSE